MFISDYNIHIFIDLFLKVTKTKKIFYFISFQFNSSNNLKNIFLILHTLFFIVFIAKVLDLNKKDSMKYHDYNDLSKYQSK